MGWYNKTKIGKHVLEMSINDVWQCTICYKKSYSLILPGSFMFFEREACLTEEEKIIKDILE